ncbi:unnamed protein product [Pleuronectes platessa]|uniref:Uncharacterized protein n=1 Tax=Pleuronectes platessa TaxID=8262 RepID=A0A9N7UQK8_PLEPL|nr:unnamed protein product [Pleuronectes platessa]
MSDTQTWFPGNQLAHLNSPETHTSQDGVTPAYLRRQCMHTYTHYLNADNSFGITRLLRSHRSCVRAHVSSCVLTYCLGGLIRRKRFLIWLEQDDFPSFHALKCAATSSTRSRMQRPRSPIKPGKPRIPPDVIQMRFSTVDSAGPVPGINHTTHPFNHPTRSPGRIRRPPDWSSFLVADVRQLLLWRSPRERATILPPIGAPEGLTNEENKGCERRSAAQARGLPFYLNRCRAAQ